MKHAGKARRAGLKIIVLSLVIVVVMIAVSAVVTGRVLNVGAFAVAAVWLVFLFFSLSFFRDPEPKVPAEAGAIVSPAHGTVDVIEETTEKTFMGGACRRISIFLSVFDVHVQNAPVAGRVGYLKHCPGKFVNAMRRESGMCNENVLMGLESIEAPGERVGVRLIAGLLARRIVPWVALGDVTAKGERTSLIQFGSRVDLYLPVSARVTVQLGAKVKGGETVVAMRG
jgi:phosphatidylserine decarboxylase